MCITDCLVCTRNMEVKNNKGGSKLIHEWNNIMYTKKAVNKSTTRRECS